MLLSKKNVRNVGLYYQFDIWYEKIIKSLTIQDN